MPDDKEKRIIKRPSLNPVTISGKKHAGSDPIPVQMEIGRNVTIGRIGIPATPKDGQQRITDEQSQDRLITIMMWDGDQRGGKCSPVQQLVVDEEKFLNAMCLLFAERICRAEEMPFAEMIGLLSEKNKPADFHNFMKEKPE